MLNAMDQISYEKDQIVSLDDKSDFKGVENGNITLKNNKGEETIHLDAETGQIFLNGKSIFSIFSKLQRLHKTSIEVIEAMNEGELKSFASKLKLDFSENDSHEIVMRKVMQEIRL